MDELNLEMGYRKLPKEGEREKTEKKSSEKEMKMGQSNVNV